MVDLVYENETEDMALTEEFFKKILEHAAAYAGLGDKKIEIGLHVIKPERSQELNRTHRQKDKPTDVLSFPLDEHGLETYGILPLGDIFICLEVAQRQASELTIPLNHELARLTVHGFLHLLGHDHDRSEQDAEKMFDLEDDILAGTKL